MKSYSSALLILIASGIIDAQSAYASPEQCKYAIEKYNSTISNIQYSLRRYTTCLSNSQGHEDCSYEFRKLKYDQSDYENVVSEMSSECRNY